MANIKVNASRKTTIVLLLILFLVVGGTGGYLLWRVNQEKTVAPTESEAGSSCCCTQACKDGFPNWPWCTCGCNKGDACERDNQCTEPCGTPPPGGCIKGSDCNNQTSCCWPQVAYCNTATGSCECKSPPNHCGDTEPRCTPTCPSGYEKCSGTDCPSDAIPVTCTEYCTGCNNKYLVCGQKCKKKVTNICGDGTKGGSEACDPPGSVCTAASGKQSTCSSTCTCPEPANICGDGTKGGSEACDPPGSVCTAASGKQSTCSSTCTCPEPPIENTCDARNAKWVIKPATSIPYGQLTPFEYVTGDTDGVQNANIIVKVDGRNVSVTKIPATDNAPNITVKGNLNGIEGPLSPGNHKLEISWNDIHGKGGVPCYAYADFTVGQAPVNTCDAVGAKWVKQPSSRVEFGKPIPFEYVTGDTDGVQNANIIVKLDGTSVPVTKIPAVEDVPMITVKGTLNSSGTLVSGSHKLEISWNDVKGAGGVPCYVYSMITILPENPEWDIEKKVVGVCVNDWTANPISNLSYTITITNTNTGSGSGTISKIEDTLDPKVDPTKVTNISNGGVISNGKITWSLTSPLSDFDPGESKSFTYSVSVNKEYFGIYENTVIAVPGTGEGDLEASANIEARCNVPGEPGQPDTGIFDDYRNIVILGAILLFTGLGWSWITDSFYSVKQRISYENKSRFEKRVSKR